MTHLEFLVQELFKEHTKYEKVPSTEEEFLQHFSNKDYEKVLKGILIGANIIKK